MVVVKYVGSFIRSFEYFLRVTIGRTAKEAKNQIASGSAVEGKARIGDAALNERGSAIARCQKSCRVNLQGAVISVSAMFSPYTETLACHIPTLDKFFLWLLFRRCKRLTDLQIPKSGAVCS